MLLRSYFLSCVLPLATLALLLAITGCEKAETPPVGVSGSTGSSETKADVAAGANAGVKLVDVLKNPCLNEEAAKKFQAMVDRGTQAVPLRIIDVVIAESHWKPVDTVEVASKWKSKRGLESPTSSTNAKALDADIPAIAPLSATERIKSYAEFEKLGIRHFESKKLWQLENKSKPEVVAWMNEVYDTYLAQVPVDWDDLMSAGDALGDKYSGLKHEPMFLYLLGLANRMTYQEKRSIENFKEALRLFSRDDYPARAVAVAIWNIRIGVNTGGEDTSDWSIALSVGSKT